MRLGVLVSTLAVVAWAGMSSATQAQINNSCSRLCDCRSLMCTDFCSPSACGNGACRKKFDALVKVCKKSCDQCNRLSKSKKG